MKLIFKIYFGATHKLDKLAAYDVLDEIDCLRVGVLDLAKDEHLRNSVLMNVDVGIRQWRTIWEISCVYL